MQKFSYIDVASSGEAIPLLGAGRAALAGGTDLLPLMKDGLAAPEALVNLKRADDLRGLREDEDGLHIGALTTLAELERSPLVRERYPALAESAAQAASPQLRAMATLGGNLLQQVRCWYYRSDAACWMKGGADCPARDGENQYHAIWDQSPCVAVHPSDPPAALLALGAWLRIAGPAGERAIALADFLQPPAEDRRALHTLAADELIREVVLPPAAGPSVYIKAMDRAAWAYALVSVAAVARVDGGRLYEPRIVLGGVANTPWQPPELGALLEGQPLDEGLIRRAGELAAQGAAPLAKNGYKVALVRNLVGEALRQLAGLA
ncbi:MAG TPA: FAD binding domain-containing protein [Herpetosiphonaceae bacterium]|nr:FAD binding domain-containing protein [Herpetosiphonaceae bacterium]